VFLALVGTHPQNISQQAANVVLQFQKKRIQCDGRRLRRKEPKIEVGFVFEVFKCDLGSGFTCEGVRTLAVYGQ
jgi:hypothetical protein